MRDDIVREFIMIRQDSKPNTEKRAVCYSRLKKKSHICVKLEREFWSIDF